MATLAIASMSAFDLEGGEDWVEYAERFEQYLLANKTDDDTLKRAVFLATIGAPGYKLLRSLAGNNVKDKSMEELCKLMKDHLQPAPNSIAQRFHFYKRDRKNGETVGAYVAVLRKLSEYCEFGDKLDDYLRDRLVCGLNSERVQQKLLSVKDLTLDKAVKTALSFEAAYKDTKAIQGGSEQDRVNRLGEQNQQGGSSRRECYCCGSTLHLANACKLRNVKCYGCGNKGHLRKVCKVVKGEGTKVGIKMRTKVTR